MPEINENLVIATPNEAAPPAKPITREKILVRNDGDKKVATTPEKADAEANSALASAQQEIAGIPGARAWMEDQGGGTRTVKIFIPEEEMAKAGATNSSEYLEWYRKQK